MHSFNRNRYGVKKMVRFVSLKDSQNRFHLINLHDITSMTTLSWFNDEEAYYELRITFDRNIRWRVDHLDLKEGNTGKDILKPGQRLMELKIAGAMPLYLAHIFSELGIYKTSFSKYGRGFENYMYLPRLEPQYKESFKSGHAAAIA